VIRCRTLEGEGTRYELILALQARNISECQFYSWDLNFSPQPPKEPEKEGEWKDEETDVVHLTDASFDEFMTSHPSVLVMFYAPCKFKKMINFGVLAELYSIT
jgi:hypothetical protein